MQKQFTDFTEATVIDAGDFLLIHDGNGVKKITKALFSEDAAASLAILSGTYEGRDLTEVFADEIEDYTDEWAWIQARLDAHNVNGLRVEDYIPIKVGTESHKARIAGINTYLNTGDNGYEVKYHIDWITDDCYGGATVQWNTSNNNNGNSTYASPFLASNLNSWLNTTLLPLLESKVRNVIKAKRLLMPSRYQSGSTLTDDNSWAFASTGSLWVPFEAEVMDDCVWSTATYGKGNFAQYPIFRNSWKYRQKKQGPNGSRAVWWLASAYSGSTTSALAINSNGESDDANASDAFYVPVCFRTMATA